MLSPTSDIMMWWSLCQYQSTQTQRHIWTWPHICPPSSFDLTLVLASAAPTVFFLSCTHWQCCCALCYAMELMFQCLFRCNNMSRTRLRDQQSTCWNLRHHEYSGICRGGQRKWSRIQSRYLYVNMILWHWYLFCLIRFACTLFNSKIICYVREADLDPKTFCKWIFKIGWFNSQLLFIKTFIDFVWDHCFHNASFKAVWMLINENLNVFCLLDLGLRFATQQYTCVITESWKLLK